jgi:hypothetical protein
MLCEGQQHALLTEKSANKHILNQHRTPKKKRKDPPKSASPVTPKAESQSASPSSFASPPRRNPPRQYRANFASASPTIANNNKAVPIAQNTSACASPMGFDVNIGNDVNSSPEEIPFFSTNNTVVCNNNEGPNSSISEYNSFAKNDELYHRFNFRSASYYTHVKDNHEEASAQIIAKANNIKLSAAKQFSSEETKQHMLLAKLSRSLTKTQLIDFSLFLQSLSKTHISQNEHISALCKNVPTRVSDFRRIYIDGKHSISQNVPKPISRMLKHHSYVPITDCIADILATNTISICNLKQTKDYCTDKKQHTDDNIFNSPVAIKVINNAEARLVSNPTSMKFDVVPCLLYLWSDDFDPINSIKKNRQSVWIITCTIFLLSDKYNVIKHTYPVGVGRKGRDHAEVITSIFQEMKNFSVGPFKVMYSTGNQFPVYVHSEIVAVMSDQLERRSNLNLGAGNHRYHRRFGYSCNMESVLDRIHACPNCTIMNKNITMDILESGNLSDEHITSIQQHNCTLCTNWFLNNNSDLLMYEPDADFPRSKLVNQKYVRSHQLTFQSLKNAIAYVHQGIENMYLSKNEAISYLRYHCFNNDTVDHIYECASNCMLLKQVSELHESNKDTDNDYEKIMSNKEKSPHLYEMYRLPEFMYQEYMFLDLFSEAPMHNLFLGISKTLYIDIQQWLKLTKNEKQFIKMSTGVLDFIHQLNLSWCRCPPYSRSGTVGFVSENFVGYERICTWFYSLLDYLPSKEQYEDPSTNPETWSKQQYRNWLSFRGLDNGGLMPIVRKRVLDYLESDNIPPILRSKGSPKELVLELIRSKSVMMQLCMGEKKDREKGTKLEAIVRYFLDLYKRFDDDQNDAKLPSYISHYNFLSLLNLPSIISKYGSLRNVWEGGVQGEGFIQLIKTELRPGLIKNWEKWSIDNILIDASIDSIYNNLHYNNKVHTNQMAEFKVYQTQVLAFTTIASGRPISAMSTINDLGSEEYYIAYRSEGVVHVVEVTVEAEITVSNSTLQYFELKYVLDTNNNAINMVLDPIKKRNNIVGVLFLPKLEATGYKDRTGTDQDRFFYTVVKSNWSNDSIVCAER